MIEAVLFDIDGTLVDSNDYHVRAWDEAFRSIGAHFEERTIHEQIGKGTDMLVPTLLPDLDEAGQERLGDLHGTIFKERYLDRVKPFPGARDLVARVHGAGLRVVIASSASAEELEHYLDLIGIRDIVTASTTADDVQKTKPAPDIFATALRKAGPIAAEQAIVVGDTPYDVEGAGKCGIAAVAVRSGGFSDSALDAAGAAAIYDDVGALLVDFDSSLLAR